MRPVEEAARIIAAGGIVAFPTETVYGLGADATDEAAVARIFEVKARPSFDPLIVHVAELDGALAVTASMPDIARRLASAFWPGPLTLVLEKRPTIPDIVTAGHPTVAVRIPAHPVALELIRLAGRPIAAPSANRFGRTSPTEAEHVRSELGESVDLVLDGGPSSVGVESTILAFDGRGPILLRPGGAPLEAIEALAGRVRIPHASEHRTASPGRLDRHYATKTPLYLSREGIGARSGGGRIGLLTLTAPRDPSPYAAIETLSPTGDLREAAARLFAALRRLDALGLDAIVATEVEERGLGRAINDRLRRAAAVGPEPGG
jgi:L-threonylcarbamoyladenylate synthase